jgi:PAS domain S-box-containing protein
MNALRMLPMDAKAGFLSPAANFLTLNPAEDYWMADRTKNQMLYVSPAYETIWGRTCESLYASPKNWFEAIHPDDRERVLQAALTGHAHGAYDDEYRIVCADGAVRWVRDRAFPMRDAGGRVIRIAGVAGCDRAAPAGNATAPGAKDGGDRQVGRRSGP